MSRLDPWMLKPFSLFFVENQLTLCLPRIAKGSLASVPGSRALSLTAPCLCRPVCRSTTTGSCRRRCGRPWAPSPTTSSATSHPAFPTSSRTPTGPWSCAPTRGSSSPTTSTRPHSPSPPGLQTPFEPWQPRLRWPQL